MNKIIESLIREDTSFLKIPEETYQAFFSKQKRYWNDINIYKKLLITGHYYFGWIAELPYSKKYQEYRNQFVEKFLLSTDFFTNKMDESKEIQFIGLYQPYQKPCFNPFSNLYYK